MCAGGMGCITQAPPNPCEKQAARSARTRPSSDLLWKTGAAVGVALAKARRSWLPPSSPTADPYTPSPNCSPKRFSRPPRSPPTKGNTIAQRLPHPLHLRTPSPSLFWKEKGRGSRRTARHARPQNARRRVREDQPGRHRASPVLPACRNGRAIRSAPNTSAPSTSPDMDFLDAHGTKTGRDPVHRARYRNVFANGHRPSLAPPGRHILSLFVQYFPYNLRPGLDLAQERERFADRVIAIIAVTLRTYRRLSNRGRFSLRAIWKRARPHRRGISSTAIFCRRRSGPNARPRLFRRASRRFPPLSLRLRRPSGSCVFGAPDTNAAQAG